jgi:hypothetical protein
MAHGVNPAGAWADEGQAGGFDAAREACILGQESISGMHGIRTRAAHDVEQGAFVQIALHRRPGANAVGFVRLPHIWQIAVGFGVDYDRAQPHAFQGAQYTGSDGSPVGN